MAPFLNGSIYTFGWIFSVWMGGKNSPIPPLIVIPILVIFQLIYLRLTHFKIYLLTILITIYGTTVGFFMEMFFLSIGLLSYSTENIFYVFFPPGWIWGLYFLFLPTLNLSLSFLNKSRSISFIFGVIGGVISYFAGQKLQAVILHTTWSYIPLGICWGIFLFFLVSLNKRLQSIVYHLCDEKKLQNPLTLYFDPHCPICSKEIKKLKERKRTGKVIFHPIEDRNSFEKSVREITYDQAMDRIHAKDHNGIWLTGIDAFSELYARVNLPLLAVILRSPFFHTIFRVIYFLWTKVRRKLS